MVVLLVRRASGTCAGSCTARILKGGMAGTWEKRRP